MTSHRVLLPQKEVKKGEREEMELRALLRVKKHFSSISDESSYQELKPLKEQGYNKESPLTPYSFFFEKCKAEIERSALPQIGGTNLFMDDEGAVPHFCALLHVPSCGRVGVEK